MVSFFSSSKEAKSVGSDLSPGLAKFKSSFGG